MKKAGNEKSLESIYKKWKKLFSKEKMEQCLFYIYRCVQPLGQDSVWKQEKQKGDMLPLWETVKKQTVIIKGAILCHKKVN